MSPPITPDGIPLDEYRRPMGISQNALARTIRVILSH